MNLVTNRMWSVRADLVREGWGSRQTQEKVDTVAQAWLQPGGVISSSLNLLFSRKASNWLAETHPRYGGQSVWLKCLL